jgi:hypothetical protein
MVSCHSLFFLPAKATGDQHQPLLQQQPDHANDDDGDENVFDVEVVPLVPDPETDP